MKLKIGSIVLSAVVVCLVIFNLNLSMGDTYTPNLDFGDVEALAFESSYQSMKSFPCEDGKGTRTRCEFDPEGTGCDTWDETLCDDSSQGTGDGQTDLCKEQGCNWVYSGSVYKCSRCNATKPAQHVHEWRLYATESSKGLIVSWRWKCSCGSQTTTSNSSPPSN